MVLHWKPGTYQTQLHHIEVLTARLCMKKCAALPMSSIAAASTRMCVSLCMSSSVPHTEQQCIDIEQQQCRETEQQVCGNIDVPECETKVETVQEQQCSSGSEHVCLMFTINQNAILHLSRSCYSAMQQCS